MARRHYLRMDVDKLLYSLRLGHPPRQINAPHHSEVVPKPPSQEAGPQRETGFGTQRSGKRLARWDEPYDRRVLTSISTPAALPRAVSESVIGARGAKLTAFTLANS